MKIGELSQKTGLAASAIRFYEEQGLLEPAARGGNGYRHYPDSALHRLHMVRAAQSLGFTLDTIRGFFTDAGTCNKGRTLEQIAVRVRAVEQEQAMLARQRTQLFELRAMLEHGADSCQDMLFDDVALQ